LVGNVYCLTRAGVNEKGFISHLLPLSEWISLPSLPPPGLQTNLPPHSFLLPTFTDLHIHAPQYLYAGTGLDLPLMEWLDRYAYRAEERMDADPELAERVYRRLVRRMSREGTGAGVVFGTIGGVAKCVDWLLLRGEALIGY
jgi:guanine deaminase